MTLPLFNRPTLTDAPAPELRPYQERAVRLAAMHIEQGKKRILLTLPTASGKMVIVASVIRRSTVPVLFVAHRMELLDQLVEQLAKQGITNIGVLRGDDERENSSASIQIASIQTLARRNKPPAGLIFIDECFVAGTLVDGIPIERITPGTTVRSFTADGAIVERRVVRTFARYPSSLVRLRIGEQELICTPTHKLWSTSGWVEARHSSNKMVMIDESKRKSKLRPVRKELGKIAETCLFGTTLRTVSTSSQGGEGQESHTPVQALWDPNSLTGSRWFGKGVARCSLLLGSPQERMASQEARGIVGRIQPQARFSPNESSQPDAARAGTHEDVGHVTKNGPQTQCAWWQWKTYSDGAAIARQPTQLADRSRCSNRQRIQTTPLQTGHRIHQQQNRNRGGRWEPPLHRTEASGPTQRAVASFSRVESVEILEPTSDGTFGGMCPGGLVYNLEVEGTHTYFANGVAVSNCHRSLADTYVEHVFNAYPEAIIIGLTASPCRSDGRPLGEVWQVLETVASYSELLKRPEWMATPDCYSSPVRADLSGVGTKHGDYDEPALAEVMSQERLVGDLLRHWLELAHRYPVLLRGQRVLGETTAGERRRTFIFAVDIRHSKAICERFAAAGVRIAHLDGTTPEDERRAMLLALRKGELECISNCNVLLEGVDAPEVKCVVHARPTQSLVLWLQSVGRTLRPWRAPRHALDGSNDPTPMWVPPLILDHAGNWDRHGPPHEDRIWSLSNVVGRKSSSKPYKLCRACFAYVQLSLHVCPYCKYAFTAQEMREPPRETSDKLVYRSDAPENVRREFFDRMATIARVRGFKPGFASAKHKEHYGEWPPSAWSDVLKSEFATDTQWQARLEYRLRTKAEEEGAWDATTEDHALSVGEDPAGMAPGSVAEDVVADDFSVYEDGSETFSAWVKREVG
jgi:DNA repair protein RadD